MEDGTCWRSKVPVLCLVDELDNAGFTEALRKVRHAADSEQVYDGRRLPSRRFYLQCVLGQARIYRVGNLEFTSGKSAAFYRLLLKSTVPVDASLSAVQCKRKYAQLTGADWGGMETGSGKERGVYVRGPGDSRVSRSLLRQVSGPPNRALQRTHFAGAVDPPPRTLGAPVPRSLCFAPPVSIPRR